MDPSLLGKPISAPTASKPQRGIPRAFLIVGSLVILAVIVAAFLLFGTRDNSGVLRERLSARQTVTLSVIADGQKNISGEDLGKLNSEVSIVLKSDDAALQAALKAAGTKPDKKITASEADTDSVTELKTAKLNGQYDSKYRSILNQKLESLQALVKELYGSSKSKSLKATLNVEYGHLDTYLNQLRALN